MLIRWCSCFLGGASLASEALALEEVEALVVSWLAALEEPALVSWLAEACTSAAVRACENRDHSQRAYQIYWWEAKQVAERQ